MTARIMPQGKQFVASLFLCPYFYKYNMNIRGELWQYVMIILLKDQTKK